MPSPSPASYTWLTRPDLTPEDRVLWRALWQASELRHPCNAPEFFEALRMTFPRDRYLILYGYQGPQLVAALPLVRTRVFGVSAFSAPGERANYLDRFPLLLARAEPALVQSLLNHILTLGHALLPEVPEAMVGLIATAASGRRVFLRPSAPVRSRQLTSEIDVLATMSPRQRKHLLDRVKKRSRELAFVWAVNPEDRQRAFATVLSIERGSYKAQRRTAFFRNRAAESFIRVLVEHPTSGLGIGVLSWQGRPVATALGFIYGRVFALFHSTFLKSESGWGAGKALYYFLFDHLRCNGFRGVDLFRGDSDLKRQFAHDIGMQYHCFCSENALVLWWWRLAVCCERSVRALTRAIHYLLIRSESWQRRTINRLCKLASRQSASLHASR